MITPKFSCSQTDTAVVVSIYCPSVRASDVEIRVDGTLLIVHLNPYYLRLSFSHGLVEDDDASVQYDAGSGNLTLTLTKQCKGQDFEDLDLLAKLLAPPKTPTRPTIEVLSSHTSSISSGPNDISPERGEILDAARNDWLFPQTCPDQMQSLNVSLERRYGFLNSYSGFFRHITHTDNNVNELGPEPEACPVEERRRRRLEREDEKWDEEYYMADYADDEVIRELIAWKYPFMNDSGDVQYTEEETQSMLRLPRKEYILSPSDNHDMYLLLIAFLFSYAYEVRSTKNDFNPESAWTICTLTVSIAALDAPPYDPPVNYVPTTSALLENFSQAQLLATLVTCYRRSLAFPLYRSFALADACRIDLANFLLKGQRMVIRCFLDLKRILDQHEVYYVYNKIWVDDLCTWLQTCARDALLRELGQLLSEIRVEKQMIGWDLETLEAAVHQARHDADGDPHAI